MDRLVEWQNHPGRFVEKGEGRLGTDASLDQKRTTHEGVGGGALSMLKRAVAFLGQRRGFALAHPVNLAGQNAAESWENGEI